MARFEEITSSIEKSYLNTNWDTYNVTFAASHITAVKFQTAATNSFYLSYRTYNKGRGWLPYVSSQKNDYAGYGADDTRYVQSIGIQVYDSSTGAKLDQDYIVMYRAYMGGRWLSWVSNAKPELMYEVSQAFNLGGELDTSSGNAGLPGSEEVLQRFQIRIFKDNNLTDTDTFTGGEVGATMSYLVDSSWNTFNKQATDSHIDGIKIQTSANKDYYLQYKTWNEGKTGYYPAVKSIEDDYAGSPGKPVQRINIQVCKNDGTKLSSGVIVMYRACVEGEWLPWVSNADPEWMRAAQIKYSLGGTLDTASSYAGAGGKNIEGVEIRIFEDDSTDAGSGSFTGDEVSLSMRYMANSASNWTVFNGRVLASPIDGLEIKTSGKDYYLLYKTWNEGKTGYYPAVKSTDDDYAGSAGKPIQRLNIKVYKNDGTQLTSGVVVMYRAYVEGKWLSWVSNADPEWMISVKTQYNLEGSLDVNSGYAGITGKNIEGIEVRVFEGKTVGLPEEELPGAEASATLSYLKDGSWRSFSQQLIDSGIDGIKIQTSTAKSYYLSYKTHNSSKTGFYPAVKSTENDYAGSPGKPIQKLSIQVYKNDGTKLTTGVVVMYRAYVDGAWLPWVSNADPEWMQSVQVKYALGGRLDTASYYAGIGGKDIEGIEVRIFEESSTIITPTGTYKLINVPFITQNNAYPTGCESVSTVMALKYAGINITVDGFINNYLDKQSYPFNPNETFGGSPYSTSGYGCYAPVIKKALDKFLPSLGYKSRALYKASLDELCAKYIDNNIPVILWGTMDMRTPYLRKTWTYNGETIQWISPEHCLLLVGYDDNHYIFNDPLKWSAPTFYSKEAVEIAYNGLFKQALVIFKETESDVVLNPPVDYVQPSIPTVPEDATSILELIEDIRELETIYKATYDKKMEQEGPLENNTPLSYVQVVLGVTNFLRSQEYYDYQWDATTGMSVDEEFVQEIKNNHEGLWNKLLPFIRKEIANEQHRELVSDGEKGSIDLAHFAATLESYLTNTLIPDFWGSWGGDLATGMAQTKQNIEFQTGVGGKYEGKSVQEIANATIGNEELSCNYTDFCSDFDAYKVSRILKEEYANMGSVDTWDYHLLSQALQWYYTYYKEVLFTKRFQWVVEELCCAPTLSSINDTVYEWMQGFWARPILVGLKGENPGEAVVEACCIAFANYVYTMIS